MRKILVIFGMALVGCSTASQPDIKAALDSISADALMSDIKTLSADDFEGRAPGTAGEEKTIAWLTKQFQDIGLKPGNPDGTYLQNVPLAGEISTTKESFTVNGKPVTMTEHKDFVAGSTRYTENVEVKDTPILFVGYGVVAPEYQWDDYKDADIKGKTIITLVNDPAIPDLADPSKLDDKMFKGNAMTYYGRWTYKYEIASEKGAAAAIIVHETGPAGYPFEVVQGSPDEEKFGIQRPDNNMSRVPVEGWITWDKAAELMKAAGLDLTALKKQALSRDFKPVELKGGKASFTVENKLRKIDSHNVIAKLEGSDPKLKDEYVVYTAHWDHLGKDTSQKGDLIFNGARDNGSGTAGLVEIARAFKKLNPAPKRSILFLAVTSEEKGLLGSAYYANNPLYPLNKTLADINMDELNVYGKTKDLTIIGRGNSTLDDLATEILTSHGRVARADPEPQKGRFYRSDHFEFAKQGVPAFDPDSGVDFEKPEAKKALDAFDDTDYHKVSDEIKPTWDLSAEVEDLKIFMELGFRVAQGDKFPEWKPGTEFKAKREAMMK
jgi:Zn-dependent M28 family amino/carboxypeptidase